MTDLLGSSFYAGVAARNGKNAASWQKYAEQQKARADRNAKVADEWRDLAHTHQARIRELEEQLARWQADAVESEAINRVRHNVLKEHTGSGLGQFISKEEFEKLIDQKMCEVREEWGVN